MSQGLNIFYINGLPFHKISLQKKNSSNYNFSKTIMKKKKRRKKKNFGSIIRSKVRNKLGIKK